MPEYGGKFLEEDDQSNVLDCLRASRLGLNVDSTRASSAFIDRCEGLCIKSVVFEHISERPCRS